MSAFSEVPERRHCLFLPFVNCHEYNIMELTLAVLSVLAASIIAICQLIRNHNRPSTDGAIHKISPAVLALSALTVSVDLISDPGSCCLIMADMMPAVVALWLLSSSMWGCSWTTNAVRVLIGMGLLLTVFHILPSALSDVSERKYASILLASMDAVLVSFLICGFVIWLRDVKTVMKSGTVWFAVSLIVDVVYVIFIIAASALWQVGAAVPGMLLMTGVSAALGIRIMTDSLFLIWRKQERIIAESMKVTSVTAVVDGSRIDDVYKDLYERIMAYFEAEKPYLDGELTITDVVKALYSNKLYISRAISQFTGRNFCQFVNYHRVMHSVECFRNNPDLKVNELGSMSGFNTIVSFNMAFRLFMGENPSDWCRREKSRLVKKKKYVVESAK